MPTLYSIALPREALRALLRVLARGVARPARWTIPMLVACACALAVAGPAREAWARGVDDARNDALHDARVAAIRVSQLPAEARAVLAAIRAGGPFASHRDGVVFGNRERLLPRRPRGYYAEYTVPTPGERTRGARRIIAGRGDTGDFRSSGEYYYTDDHYQSFRLIVQ